MDSSRIPHSARSHGAGTFQETFFERVAKRESLKVPAPCEHGGQVIRSSWRSLEGVSSGGKGLGEWGPASKSEESVGQYGGDGGDCIGSSRARA